MRNAALAIALLLTASVLAAASPRHTLSNIHKIYIAPMPNGLDQYIRAEIFHQLHGRIELVSSKGGADAVMEGTDTQKHGAARVIDHWGGLADTATAAISLVSPDSKEILWSTSAGDLVGSAGSRRQSQAGLARRQAP